MKSQKSTKKIEEGLRELIQETKHDNENLIRRSSFLLALEGLIVNLKLHTTRRLSGKLQPDPDAKVDEFFKRYSYLLGRIK